MTVSFVFIGVLIVLDVLFVVNYVAVRWIRSWTNQQQELEETDQSSVNSITRDKTSCNCLQNKPSLPSAASEYFQAFFMNVVHREPTSVMKFEKWRDLPFACGKWSTTALLLLSLSLVSIEFKGHDTMTGGMQVASRTLCMATNFSGKIDRFESKMSRVANLELSRKQFNWTRGFYKALENDTSLYGTDGFECESTFGISGSKDDWTGGNETFFPRYCEERIQAEIVNASMATCSRRQCECLKILGIRACWLGRICLEIGDSCPTDTANLETDLNDYYSESGELYGAEAQYNQTNANKTMPSISDRVSTAAARTIEKVMYQVNVASLAYVFYSLLGLFFPAPLLMFRLPYSFYIRRFLFGIHKPTFILLMIAIWWGVEYFKPFWMSPEIQLYLRMLRIGDPCLFDSDFITSKISVIKGICDDLMTMEGQFVTNTLAINRLATGVGLFANTCNCSFPNQNLINFQTPENIFVGQARQLGFMEEMEGLCVSPYCNKIFFPPKDNPFLGETSMCSDRTLVRQYLFSAFDDDAATNWWQLLWATGFLSKILIKVVATNFCIRLYYLADPLSSCGGQFEWPPGYLFRRPGQHADQTGLTRDAVRSSGMTSNEAMKLRQRKTTCLRIISFKWVIIWGILTHLCLLNLAVAPIEDKAVGMVDIIMAVAFFGIALVAIIALVCLGYFLRRRGFDFKANPDDEMKPYPLSRESKNSDRAAPLLVPTTSSESTVSTCSSEASEEGKEVGV